MAGLSFRSAVFSLVIVCFLSGSAVADTFTFTGNATQSEIIMDFFLSGPSFSISSAAPDGSFPPEECTWGTLCTIPAQVIGATRSPEADPGSFSQGTVGGVTAYDLVGGLTFSSFSFTAGPNIGSGPVTFTGDLTGYVFLPLGCEAQPGSCTAVGPQVFHLQLSGSGTGTTNGLAPPDGPDVILGVDYTFSGTATTVTPEPSSLLLLSSGLIGLAAIRRWHSLRRVNH